MSVTPKNGTTCVTFAALFMVAAIVVSLGACHTEGATMKLTSTAFADGSSIPKKYTCDGEDVAPPLAFEGVPANAKSLALVLDDPDAPAGVWDHWVVWNIPAGGGPSQGVTGRNSWGRSAWGGPCPPRGEHRYVFHLYALDSTMSLPSTAGSRELRAAMNGHVVAEATLTGRYKR